MQLIVDTRHLFLKLLRTFDIETVCEVGSLDGSDALRFRRVLPSADIIALEPNPRNFELMEADPRLRRDRIRVLPLAASDRDAEAPFFVVHAERSPGSNPAFLGMSSLHRRSDGSVLGEVVRVRTIRLDSLLASKGDGEAAIALWIDAEGMAFETIAGSAGVLGRTHLLHVEVETVPCIGAQQRLFHDVLRLLSDSGFRLLATDQPRTSTQLNALFVRTEVTRAKAAEIGWHVASERLRRPVARVALPLVPSRLRRFISRNGNDVRG